MSTNMTQFSNQDLSSSFSSKKERNSAQAFATNFNSIEGKSRPPAFSTSFSPSKENDSAQAFSASFKPSKENESAQAFSNSFNSNKRKESTQDVDHESQALLPIQILPEIGEPHPCPFFRSSDQIIKVEPLPKPKKTPIPAPVPVPVPVPVPIPRDDSEDFSQVHELLDSWLDDLCHAVVWQTVSDLSKDVQLEDYMNKISNEPQRYAFTEQRFKNFRQKLRKQSWRKDWSVKCDKPMDNLHLGVLINQAYRLRQSEDTLDNYAYRELHNELFQKSGIQRLSEDYDQELEKEWKKVDDIETKLQPPRKPTKN